MQVRRVVVFVALVGWTTLLLASQEKKSVEPYAELTLRDGSVLKGVLKQKEFMLTTSYGELAFPTNRIQSIVLGGGEKEKDAVASGGETYEGHLRQQEPLAVETKYGTLKVPLKDIRRIVIVDQVIVRVVSDTQTSASKEKVIELDDLAVGWVSIEGVKWIATPTFAKEQFSVTFHRKFEIPEDVDLEDLQGKLVTAVDNRARYFLNDKLIGELMAEAGSQDYEDNFKRLHTFALKNMRKGVNELRIEAINDDGPGGLIFQLEVRKREK